MRQSRAAETKVPPAPEAPAGLLDPLALRLAPKLLSRSAAHNTPAVCNASAAQPPWCRSAAHLPPSVSERASPANQHPNLMLPNPNLRVPAGDGGFLSHLFHSGALTVHI